MKTFSHNKGFTLIETLIAITILTLSIFGAFSAVQSGISASTYSKEEITAYYLAQEAVEQIRNMRDRNALDPTSTNWLQGIAAQAGDPCQFDSYCYVDAVNNRLTACPNPTSSDSCPMLLLDSSGFYEELSGTPTPYKRYVKLHQISATNPTEVRMDVTVTWTKGTLITPFTIHEDILNWQ